MINKRTRLKICGFTRVEDVVFAINLGVDAIGLVFYENSKRFISIEQAINIRKEIPPFVDVVALFVNATKSEINLVQDKISPDFLQFHGNESEDFCSMFKQKFLKVFRVGAPGLENSNDLERACKSYSSASGWLFDSYTDVYGGSGISFDHKVLHSLCRSSIKNRVIVSGGVNETNVEDIIRYLDPFALDFSSCVEVSPGIKSLEKMSRILNIIEKTNNCVSINT
ncbi:phosphoribosylanthranilate isomerase [Candidatus Kinetoplastidibacterium crithidiae]|uniref:N-(5'-phosphoribosyl)anthranilate isomerase n=1 Tax=Candidatus Kinetoplastidibacterium crithidiae TCC036E TaxID=1208918 RepID=M1LW95_9PROT|nr:phosphoribosylanthranilate isomerase [Candidatus Kinetoplastibacterium crithidii]AFZ82834.1 N-(5'-phosphoribosyl)anthranilate isomerase [Candidatus Kinetoplastibacterium crithidii (ex Angomonas deanei ATCC 30255)]AGF47514.1 phosphoribosylanthranilate isomerase [Candidatus Kinetoplastibacterium crithidii TCC036E]